MDLSEFQAEIFGSVSNEGQIKFYSSGTYGYLQQDQDESKLLAVLVLAFWKTLPVHSTKYHKVLVLVPPVLERWVLAQVKAVTRTMLERFSECPELYNLVVQAVSHLQLGARVLGMSDAPERWVSYGFRSEDPIPAWMKSQLLPLPQGALNAPQKS